MLRAHEHRGHLRTGTRGGSPHFPRLIRTTMPQTPFLLIDAGSTRLKWATAGPRGPIHMAGEIATREATRAWTASLPENFPGIKPFSLRSCPRLLPIFAGLCATPSRRQRHVARPGDFVLIIPSRAKLERTASPPPSPPMRRGLWPAITVACGTATAFTVLDAQGRLCGGVIAPGLQTQLAALVDATAQLPATKLRPVRRLLARSTEEAIRIGVVLNFQGGVKEILSRLSGALPKEKPPHILLTGGNAPLS